MEPYELIEAHEKVLAHFGQWPSFHDGEVHRVILDRIQQDESGSYIATVEIYLRGWIMTPEIAETGFYKQEHDAIVHFRFDHVSDFELEGLNHQNVLSSLNITLVHDGGSEANALHIELEHCYGLSGAFNAREAKVVDIVPYVGRENG